MQGLLSPQCAPLLVPSSPDQLEYFTSLPDKSHQPLKLSERLQTSSLPISEPPRSLSGRSGHRQSPTACRSPCSVSMASTASILGDRGLSLPGSAHVKLARLTPAKVVCRIRLEKDCSEAIPLYTALETALRLGRVDRKERGVWPELHLVTWPRPRFRLSSSRLIFRSRSLERPRWTSAARWIVQVNA